MTRATLSLINSRIQRLIDPRVELVRGEGYHYLVWDDPEANIFETESIMVPYTSQMTPTRWQEAARDFAARFLPDPTIAGGDFPIAG